MKIKILLCFAFAVFIVFGESPVVDLDAGELRFAAETTGVAPGDIAEFYIIAQSSGHDYEALFKSRAKVEDIAAGLLELGLGRGEGVDIGKFRFWSKGERVNMFVKFPDKDERVPLDSLVMDTRTGKPVPPVGFVFVGAEIPENTGPGSIVPSYNEETTLFDVPRYCPQNEVYEKYRVAAGFPADGALPVEIIMVPEKRPADSPKRVMELDVKFAPEGVSIGADAPVPAREAVLKFRALSLLERDVFMTPLWDGALTAA